jgi:hypothetical protein
MAEINVNEAYDLSLFDTRRAQPQPDLPEKKTGRKNCVKLKRSRKPPHSAGKT